ncbi:MAG: amidohydrolase family protein [bacterium]|jgi:N-acyl-D-amino-acid deacylase|nr:amidohydrolase family protein [bacterium]
MKHDLVIRNGRIVDGTGGRTYEGDVAVRGDTITGLGEVPEQGVREIDAAGAAITPGFIDTHTHLDGQIGWDPQLTPASWHGVTTVLMGNCGVTFAPVRGDDRERLAEMMESVEDIPRHAILSGLPWDWSSYGEYLDSITRKRPALNVAGLVGHATARFYVMGERAIDEQPTEDEIQELARLVGRSVKEGAVGFSTSRIEAHRIPDGRCIPGTFAGEQELVAISRAVGAEGGMLQSVINSGERDLPGELTLMRKQLEAARTRLLFSAPWTPGEGGKSAYQNEINNMRNAGLEIWGTTQPRAAGFLSGLQTNMLFGIRLKGPAWRNLRDLDVDGRLNAIRDKDFRSRLIEEGRQMESADGIWQSIESSKYSIPTRRSFWMGGDRQPHYEAGADQSLGHLAEQAGEHPAETWLRLMDESDGRGLFHIRFVNEDLAVLPDFMREDWIVPGVGDAGAHCGVISDVGWATFVLSYWHRDSGVYSLEEAVHMLTEKQARVLGLKDRGVLALGQKADINVIDVDRVSECQPERVNDFPGGAARLIQRGVGYRCTVVNGEVILENDELTGGQSGVILRNRGGVIS